MKRLMWITAAVALAAGCGGGSGSYSSVTPSATPSPSPSTATSGTETIAIVGTSGSQAFNPNPVQVTAGDRVVFRNNDSRTHHLVMDDGSADIGTIAPGGSSSAMTLNSGSYHCTIHPSMVGSINGPVPAGPNCPNGYCG